MADKDRDLNPVAASIQNIRGSQLQNKNQVQIWVKIF